MKHIHQQGGRSDGLYNAPKRSPLSDTPQIGGNKLNLLKSYIERYLLNLFQEVYSLSFP